ncbi:MAG: hypothetical protein ACYCZQ_00075 [Burkholderiales bacterium]
MKKNSPWLSANRSDDPPRPWRRGDNDAAVLMLGFGDRFRDGGGENVVEHRATSQIY